MTGPREITRRRFGRAAGLTALAFPTIVGASALGRQGRPSPSDRLTLGFIGVGIMNRGHLGKLLGRDDCQILAVCDVDTTRRDDARARVEKKYGEGTKGDYKGCSAVVDFREVLGRGDIDAVVIATPDHWHAPAAILACAAGKDVYVEKPCSHNLREGRLMVEAARAHKRVMQVGTQARSRASTIRAIEVARSGVLGKIRMAKAWNVQLRENIGHGKEGPPPAEVEF